ncbi:hypothetical protein R1flu_010253 [Riccia fluitans]|uniref:Abnormal spindle-like microcephaly-associated protein n=1 Tax=Riccia fluitans TaxID=41844 RepID=A0ABD1Z4G0_9MARC
MEVTKDVESFNDYANEIFVDIRCLKVLFGADFSSSRGHRDLESALILPQSSLCSTRPVFLSSLDVPLRYFFGFPEMRRVVSYGGASGVPASQRLKLMLSMTAGMHLLANEVKQEQQGFLAPVVEAHQERIIHRTSGVTRNLSSIESFKVFANRKRDSFASEEISTLDSGERCAQQGQGGETGAEQSEGVKARYDQDLVGSSAGAHFGLDGIRQNEDAVGNPAVNRHGQLSSSSLVGNDDNFTKHSNDLTNTPECGRGANLGVVCQPGPSRLNKCTKDYVSLEEALGSDEAHAEKPIVNCSSERLQEGCQSETSSVSRDVDQDHGHSRAFTSSVVPTALVGRADSCTFTDSYEQAQATNCNEDKIIIEPCIPKLGVFQDDLSLERHRRETDAALKIQSWWKGRLQRKEYKISEDAALRIQRWWKGRLQRKEYRKSKHAVLRIQSRWKGWLQRREYRVLKEITEITAATRRNQVLNNAAVVLQTSWRAAQSRRILKHLRIERTVRNRAATVVQSHFRGHCSRWEHKRSSCAALIIQNCWRRYRSSRQALVDSAVSLQEAEERRVAAVITLQSYARGFIVRQKIARMHKAAIRIQRRWKAYSRLCMQAATKLQAYIRAFLVRRKYATHKKIKVEERAAVLIQAYARGHLVRCHLTILHTAALIIQLQWRRYSQKCQLQAATADRAAVEKKSPWEDDQADLLLQSGREFVWVENEVQMECFDELLNGDDDLLVRSDHEALEFSHEVSRLEEVIDNAIEREIEDYQKPGAKDFRDDSGLRPLLNGELSTIPTGEVPVGKVSHHEDWTNVSVDHLDECLDTCLASLRPVPSELSASILAVDQCFPKFVILEEAHPSLRQAAESTGCVDGIEPVEGSVSVDSQAATNLQTTPRLKRLPSRKGVKHELSRNVLNISSDTHLNQAILSSRDSPQPAHESSAELSKDVLSSETADQQVVESDQGGGNGQGKSRRAESLKRSEERLQQFAQVFLLQRHITLQQQRAQSRPPFPPPAHVVAGSSSSSHQSPPDETGSIEHVGAGSSSDVSPLDQTESISKRPGLQERNSSSVSAHYYAGISSAEYDADRGHVSCSDTSSGVRREVNCLQIGGASSLRQHRQAHAADVVVDMVLLLKKIEEVYGISDVDAEDANSLCFPTRIGDIEEGGAPILDRRKMSSTLGFTKSISMSQISFPSVNAVLLVIIAMVVYTKTICRGVIFRTKQTHKKL